MKKEVINNKTILNDILTLGNINHNKVMPVIEEGTSNDNIEVSYKQVAYFENVNNILVDMYKSKKALKGNEEFLNNANTLTNYKIEIASNYINIVDKHTNYKYGYFSLGNRKLQRSKHTTFLIWNITQKVTCKYQCNDCKYCYADKYPNNTIRNISSRNKNLILSTYSNFDAIFSEVIEVVNKIYGSTNIYIRIHESGDYYNLAYFKKVQYVLHSNVYKNVSLSYTKNIEVLPYVNNDYSYNTVRYSVMSSTPLHMQEQALQHVKNFYVCVDDIEPYEKTNNICNMNCTTCLMCYDSNINTIVVKKH